MKYNSSLLSHDPILMTSCLHVLMAHKVLLVQREL
jgi:hypothetical protein